MTRAFEGIRVIDTTHVIAGPFATYQLALLGADVIKVEHPKEPDQTRGSGSDWSINAKGMGTQYLNHGANKRSITLDLKSETGRDILKRLVKDADVFVENYRTDALPALGLGYEDLKKINPRLIYCSLTAFGDNGPRRNQTGYDQVIQAYSGVMSITGTPETGPLRCGPQLLDFGGGIIGALAISSALFRRERTGKGQHLTPSLADTAFALMSAQITASQRTGTELTFQTTDRKHAGQSCFIAKDGERIMLGAGNDHQWARFWDLLGEPERGKRTLQERYEHAAEDRARIAELMLTKPAQEWEDLLQEHHVAAARLRTVKEALDDPQAEARHNRHWFRDGCPDVEGAFSVPEAIFGADDGAPAVDTPPPLLGQHTDEVLAEVGMSVAEIAAARKEGAI